MNTRKFLKSLAATLAAVLVLAPGLVQASAVDGLFCDSVTVDSCLRVCPAGDELFTVTTVDSSGNPICGLADLWLDFENCSTVPASGKHPFWPRVKPDSCNAGTGQHFFSVYAGLTACLDCTVDVVVDGLVCRQVLARFFDTNADLCVQGPDFVGGGLCTDYNCDVSSEVSDSLFWAPHFGHCSPSVTPDTCCEYLAPGFADYAPQGVPDFDQKQNQPAWSDGINPTHCGPVAMADALWWFDSGFDSAGTAPPTVSDAYSLVRAYGAWDDHDSSNVVPLVNDLATLMATNQISKGTTIDSLVSGTRQFIIGAGLAGRYPDTLVSFPDLAYIRDRVQAGCAVTLLLGFYELDSACCRIGGHFVTTAGVCLTNNKICLSDPWFDALESGPAHAADVHNDATLTSGPHGQAKHDDYIVSQINLDCLGSVAEEIDWSFGSAERTNFLGQNQTEGVGACSPSGAKVSIIVEYAYVICSTDGSLVGVEDDLSRPTLPGNYILRQNYPNPFNPGTVIEFSLPERAVIRIEILNLLGQVVATLADGSLGAGSYRVRWNGRDQQGQKVASGVYLYRLRAGDWSHTRKMLLLK